MPPPRQNRSPSEFIDATGTYHDRAASPRIVSLVPSITELVCDLGLSKALVGRTGFCIHPRAIVRSIPKLGGTKDVNLRRLRELAPTHVIVNIDENEKPTVDEIRETVPHVIATHPLTPLDNVALYRLLGGIFDVLPMAEKLAAQFIDAYDDVVASCSALPRRDVLYLIWRKPWMTVSRDTYISRMLALIGWDTSPEITQSRYPEIELNAATLNGLDYVLLSSEPYRFGPRDIAEIAALLPHDRHRRVQLIDGEMTSWYGSRAISGLRYLKELRLGAT